jgi:hypothetical protein
MGKAAGPTTRDAAAAIGGLLQRYKCPVPYHQVRAHVLGNIVSPVGAATPVRVLKRLWGGKLPAFASAEAKARLVDPFVTGLWTPLSKHQEPHSTFRLVVLESKPTSAGLAEVAMTRRQEIEGFVDGLFGETDDEVDFPERAEDSLRELARMRGALVEIATAAATWQISGTKKNIEATLRLLRTISHRAEQEINAVVVSCALAGPPFAGKVSSGL